MSTDVAGRARAVGVLTGAGVPLDKAHGTGGLGMTKLTPLIIAKRAARANPAFKTAKVYAAALDGGAPLYTVAGELQIRRGGNDPRLCGPLTRNGPDPRPVLCRLSPCHGPVRGKHRTGPR